MHAYVSGSIASRILACPGSLTAKQTVPDTSSTAADRGSMLHEVVVGLQEGRWSKPEDAVGHTAFGQTLTQADAKAAVLPAWRAVQSWVGTKDVRYEQYVTLHSIDDAGGTADVLTSDGILDLKFGSYPVKVKDNAQLLFYLAAAIESGAVNKRTRYRMAIVQPAIKKTPIEHSTSYVNVIRYVDKLKRAVDNAHSSKPQFKGGEHCRFCPARQGCGYALASQFASLGLANTKLNLT